MPARPGRASRRLAVLVNVDRLIRRPSAALRRESAACAAASRATGTRYGEQLT